MMDSTHDVAEPGVQQHSIVRSIVLHLLPGVLILVFFVFAAPLLDNLGAPSFMALLLAIALVLIPFELGYLLHKGKKRNGAFSLEGIVLYRQPMPWWQYIVLSVPLFLWAGLAMTVVSPAIDSFLIDSLFAWLADWFFIAGFAENLEQYTRSALILTAILNVVLNGLAGPIVEELYFRGYLLPRMARLGRWAPLVNSLLFSFYHSFTPWQNVGRLLAFVPLYYAVWWKRNIYLGMIVHCAGNLVGALMMLALVLGLA
ncbi:lysostaphin resistance A-like protein [Chloroflexota bacterium]